MVRITEQTRRDLTTYLNRLRLAIDRNPEAFPHWLREGQVNLGHAIRWLLAQKEAHQARSRESDKRRRRKEREEVRWTLAEPPEAVGPDRGDTEAPVNGDAP